jgi:hypothetical protein
VDAFFTDSYFSKPFVFSLTCLSIVIDCPDIFSIVEFVLYLI